MWIPLVFRVRCRRAGRIEEQEEYIAVMLIRVGNSIVWHSTVECKHISCFHPGAREFVSAEELECSS
jgi:hypothetical protein